MQSSLNILLALYVLTSNEEVMPAHCRWPVSFYWIVIDIVLVNVCKWNKSTSIKANCLLRQIFIMFWVWGFAYLKLDQEGGTSHWNSFATTLHFAFCRVQVYQPESQLCLLIGLGTFILFSCSVSRSKLTRIREDLHFFSLLLFWLRLRHCGNQKAWMWIKLKETNFSPAGKLSTGFSTRCNVDLNDLRLLLSCNRHLLKMMYDCLLFSYFNLPTHLLRQKDAIPAFLWKEGAADG